jgi:hypothetical protein
MLLSYGLQFSKDGGPIRLGVNPYNVECREWLDPGIPLKALPKSRVYLSPFFVFGLNIPRYNKVHMGLSFLDPKRMETTAILGGPS